MSTKQIVTKTFNVETAESFIDSVRNESAYYVFAAKHTPYAENSDQVILNPLDSVSDAVINIYDDMIFGKKVDTLDVMQMAPRYNWTEGTAYAMYDDQDVLLFTKAYYATVNVGSQAHVYKCLYNNKGANSTVEPSGTDINPFETPGDGYIWKYMYTANDTIMRKFATNEYIPVMANTYVTDGANPGSIEVVAIDEAGVGYNNYVVSEFESPSDIKVGGSVYLYGLGSAGESTNDFYNNCIIKITSGAAKDEYRIISDYYITGGQKIIVIDYPFVGVINATDTYEIYPYVFVFDTGGVKQTNCIARAIISDTTGNSVHKIEILEAGSGYRKATALIIPDPVVGVVSNSSLRAIMSPPGGHGSNAHNELGANFASVSVKFVENEGPLSAENDYRTVGLIKNPLFANVNIKIDPALSIGAFAVGEEIFQYSPVPLTGTVEVFSNSTVTGTNTFFDTSLSVGDPIVITNGSVNIYANVLSIASNTSIQLNTNSSFSDTGCTIIYARDTASIGKMTANSAGEIFVTDLNPHRLTGRVDLVGSQSSTTSEVDQGAAASERITINGRNADNYKYFTQLTRFVGNLTTGTFFEDETVTQDSAVIHAQPSAKFHSFVENGTTDEFFVTNVENVFQTEASEDSDGVITGSNSAAQFVVTAKFNGDLVPDSGEIVYLENLSPISRANTQTETIKLILKF